MNIMKMICRASVVLFLILSIQFHLVTKAQDNTAAPATDTTAATTAPTTEAVTTAPSTAAPITEAPTTQAPSPQAPTQGFGDCIDTSNCTGYLYTVCTGGQCVCDNNHINFIYDSVLKKCVLPTTLGDICDPTFSLCTAANTSCIDDGYGQGTLRCLCKPGYILVSNTSNASDQNNLVCGLILSSAMDINCQTCINNLGICFDTTGDQKKDGCKCLISMGGPDCNTTYVNVTCNSLNFTMDICYTDHPGVTLSGVGGSMSVWGKGTTPACVAVTNPDNFKRCNKSYNAELILDLHSAGLQTCGISNYQSSLNNIRLETTISIQPAYNTTVIPPPIIFNVYCQFASQQSSAFNGFGIINVPGNQRGQEIDPNITFTVQNSLGQPIPQGVALRLGDKIRLLISLVQDGTYESMSVQRCTASSSGYMPDPYATTVDLIYNGCPTRSGIFTLANTWMRPAPSAVNLLLTGLFPTFKLPTGNIVFIFCTVKLCLSGDATSCVMPNCGMNVPANVTSPTGRRKRQAITGSPINITQLSTQLIVLDDAVFTGKSNDTGTVPLSKAQFGILIGVLAAIVVIFAVTAVVLFIRHIRNREKKLDEVALTHQPQRFSFPRIPRPSMRL